ncbi:MULTISPECIES: hypothetical protein [Escherichia]|nr:MULTISPECIES: hypothetical protein [Escherichia]MEC9684762.1 hypothetical protein [Escherichia marmotae]MEC9702726.1 hypothetical protein [Escherichia marmotae]MEC9948522.1 hypothetical protein [Escherichia marmotae]MED0058082.1 hypothetical protein [Escherichia marmotae]MED0113065.1 hypothetical protein [Escherichia marmotae]
MRTVIVACSPDKTRQASHGHLLQTPDAARTPYLAYGSGADFQA